MVGQLSFVKGNNVILGIVFAFILTPILLITVGDVLEQTPYNLPTVEGGGGLVIVPVILLLGFAIGIILSWAEKLAEEKRNLSLLILIIVILGAIIVLVIFLSNIAIKKSNDPLILKQAVIDSNSNLCGNILNERYKSDCYSQVAQKLGDPQGCMRLKERKESDWCLRTVAIVSKNIDICNLIEEKTVKASCQSAVKFQISQSALEFHEGNRLVAP